MWRMSEPKSEPKRESKNVMGRPLAPCGMQPKTGYFRDGCCNTDETDAGSHTVCARMTAAFLEFSKKRGNDLSTPAPQYGFAGLSPGDRWCLCAARWKEAFDAGAAPQVYLASTHERALELIPLATLQRFAVDMN